MSQPCEAEVYFNKKMKAFQCGARLLSGLCPTLKRLFYPDFDFLKATKYNCDTVEVKMVSHQGSRKKKSKRKPKTRVVPIWIAKKMMADNTQQSLSVNSSSSSSSIIPARNVNVGIRVDNEVKEIVKLCDEEKVKFRTVYFACFPLLSEPIHDDIRAKTLHWLPHTRALLKFLYNQKWEPSKAQFVVSDPTLGVATAMDLLCMDLANSRWIVVELKVGYDYAECAVKGSMMQHPFSKWDTSIRNQHHLQLLGTTLLFERSHSAAASLPILSVLIRFKTPYVGSDDVSLEVEALDSYALERKSTLLAVLQEVAPTPKKKNETL